LGKEAIKPFEREECQFMNQQQNLEVKDLVQAALGLKSHL
jgi:hypothetical protein